MFAQEEKEAKLTIGRRANARAGVGVHMPLVGTHKASHTQAGEGGPGTNCSELRFWVQDGGFRPRSLSQSPHTCHGGDYFAITE